MNITPPFPFVDLPMGKLKHGVMFLANPDNTELLRPVFVVVRSDLYNGYWLVHEDWREDLLPVDRYRSLNWWEATRDAVGPFRKEDICRAYYIVNDIFSDLEGESWRGFEDFKVMPLPGKLSDWEEFPLDELPLSITSYSCNVYDKPPYLSKDPLDLIYDYGLLLQPEVDWVPVEEYHTISEKLERVKDVFPDSLLSHVGILRSIVWNSHMEGALLTSEDRDFEKGSFSIVDFSPDIIFEKYAWRKR